MTDLKTLRIAKTGDLASFKKHLEDFSIEVKYGWHEYSHAACRHGNLPISEGFDESSSQEMCLRVSSSHGHANIVEYLVERGADIHVFSRRCIRTSIERGYLDVFKIFVNQLATQHIQIDESCVDIAMTHYQTKIVEYILSLGVLSPGISTVAEKYICDAKTTWTVANHKRFSRKTNELFGTLLLGIQKLEEGFKLDLCDQMMIEDMLEWWAMRDDWNSKVSL